MGGENEIAWFCTYTPLEILDAAGLFPVRHFGDPLALESADALLHQAICPYIRACLAAEMEENRPHHAVFANSCDGMRRLHDAWKALFPGDFVFLLDLPRNEGTWGERILAAEYRRLAAAVGEYWGRSVTPRGLREAARAREELRLSYRRCADGMSGAARLRLAKDFQAGAPGDIDLDARESARGGVPVLLTGNLLNPEGLVSVLDRAGARVMRMDLCNGDRAFSSPVLVEGEDLEEMYLSLARGYLGRHPCARMVDARRRLDLLLEEVREAGASGVVYACLKFCDSYLYDFPRVQKRLKEAGVPLLRLESDYADGHAGQLLTRIEAFLEML